MNADTIVYFERGRITRLERVIESFADTADFVLVVSRGTFHKRLYGIKVKGERNPYAAFAALERFFSSEASVLELCQMNVEYKGYGQ